MVPDFHKAMKHGLLKVLPVIIIYYLIVFIRINEWVKRF